jgi:hypothetical protein
MEMRSNDPAHRCTQKFRLRGYSPWFDTQKVAVTVEAQRRSGSFGRGAIQCLEEYQWGISPQYHRKASHHGPFKSFYIDLHQADTFGLSKATADIGITIHYFETKEFGGMPLGRRDKMTGSQIAHLRAERARLVELSETDRANQDIGGWIQQYIGPQQMDCRGIWLKSEHSRKHARERECVISNVGANIEGNKSVMIRQGRMRSVMALNKSASYLPVRMMSFPMVS